jgi:hypothetical protein
MNDASLREPAYLVLTALAGEARHGYSVIEDVAQISAGRVQLHTGRCTRSWTAFARNGLIEVDREEVVAVAAAPLLPPDRGRRGPLAEETDAIRRHARVAANGCGGSNPT